MHFTGRQDGQRRALLVRRDRDLPAPCPLDPRLPTALRHRRAGGAKRRRRSCNHGTPGTSAMTNWRSTSKSRCWPRPRRSLEQGVLVELVRSAKPTARFHQLACTIRFAVPGDAQAAHCNCAEPTPCSHVPLAIWAFRKLPSQRRRASSRRRRLMPPCRPRLWMRPRRC